jgi:hypothetical protein
MRACPHCLSAIPSLATVCAHCQRDVPPVSVVGRVATVPPNESDVLPEGDQTCQRLACAMRGVPTQDKKCVICGHFTVPLTAFRGALMSAPGVTYNPNAVKGVETESVPAASATALEHPDGEWTCIRLNCDRRGYRTRDERCPSCGHHTARATSHRGPTQ